MGNKPKLAIVHSGFNWTGGAEAVCVWTIEALKEKYDITLISINKIPIKKVNRFYGTHLGLNDFHINLVPMPERLRNSFKFWYFKKLLTMRYCKSIKNEFDLLISTYFEMDFGRKGIQYIHSPSFVAGFYNEFEQFLSKHQQSYIKRLYRKLLTIIFDFSVQRVKQNTTLVNSNWTGRLVKNAYGINTQTVYPPVKEDFPYIPWDEKENGFVCVGRIDPTKRIETIIEILSQVKKTEENIHLHIVGSQWDAPYYRKIKKLQEKNSSWVLVEGRIDRNQFVNLIASHKYGIHGMRNEHFGIAVAEMIKAGALVFVPNDGGQVEIIGSSHLIYKKNNEAIKKIIELLKDEELQNSLRKHLDNKTQLFSTTTFMERVRKIVDSELGDN